MVTGSFRVAALDESTWPAYRALIELNNGVFGGCWCLGFHTEGAAKGQVRTFETKRELKHARVLAGTTHAALVFDGDDCVGWAQFGTPAELPRIKSLKAYEAGSATCPTGVSPAATWARGTAGPGCRRLRSEVLWT